MESEINKDSIPAGQFCQTVREYKKESDDGYGRKTPAIVMMHCGNLTLNTISGLENLQNQHPFCWVCTLKGEALIEKELTRSKPPVKICGIRDQPIPEELLTLDFDDITQKSDEELLKINERLQKYQNAP